MERWYEVREDLGRVMVVRDWECRSGGRSLIEGVVWLDYTALVCSMN